MDKDPNCQIVGTEVPRVTYLVKSHSQAWIGGTIVACVLFISCAILMYNFLPSMRKAQEDGKTAIGTLYKDSKEVVKRIVDGVINPKVIEQTVYQSFSGEMKDEDKLVVKSSTFHVGVKKTLSRRILFEKLSLGDAVSEVRVQGCKVQYVLPLAGFCQDSIKFVPENNELVLKLPHPIVDPDIVDVPSDPSKWEIETTRGWARFPSTSEDLQEQAKAEIRDALIAEANKAIYIDEAVRSATGVVEKMLRPVLVQFGEGIKLRIDTV